jgi:DNA-binding NtrC family response regulator
MEALIVENDPLVRDQLKIALQQFPDVHVAVGTGYVTLNELRSRSFDCVFLGVDAAQHESLKLLSHLRAIDPSTQLFVVASASSCKDLAVDKAKYDVHAFLTVPLVPRELFAQLGRLFERRTERVERAAPARRPARAATAPARKR